MKIFNFAYGISTLLLIQMLVIDRLGDVLIEPNLINELWYGDFRTFYMLSRIIIALVFIFMSLLALGISAYEEEKQRKDEKSFND